MLTRKRINLVQCIWLIMVRHNYILNVFTAWIGVNVYMDVYGFVWMCMDVYGCVWMFMDV